LKACFPFFWIKCSSGRGNRSSKLAWIRFPASESIITYVITMITWLTNPGAYACMYSGVLFRQRTTCAYSNQYTEYSKPLPRVELKLRSGASALVNEMIRGSKYNLSRRPLNLLYQMGRRILRVNALAGLSPNELHSNMRMVMSGAISHNDHKARIPSTKCSWFSQSIPNGARALRHSWLNETRLNLH